MLWLSLYLIPAIAVWVSAFFLLKYGAAVKISIHVQMDDRREAHKVCEKLSTSINVYTFVGCVPVINWIMGVIMLYLWWFSYQSHCGIIRIMQKNPQYDIEEIINILRKNKSNIK